MHRPRVVITGLGCVTPLGPDLPTTWAALVAGESGVRPISRFDATGFPTTFGAELKGCPEVTYPGELDPKARFALAAATEAVKDAGLTAPEPGRFGVSVGAEVSRPDLDVLVARTHQLSTEGVKAAFDAAAPADFLTLSAYYPATVLARAFGARGPCLTTSTACTSSAQAIGDALRVMRRGDADVMLVGGTDRLVEALMVLGFDLLGALSTRNAAPERASRPFDRDRDGFVLGEGAGFLVLETEAHAKRRGARIHAELLGYGASANAWRITDSPADGRGASAAMQAALADAEVAPEQVDYVNAHGTSTLQNDASECAALHTVFGARAARGGGLKVSSTKSMMGHLVAACGAVELIACVMAIKAGVLPPTVNFETPDPACDVDCVPNQAERADVQIALSNAFGFGGSNGSLVVGRYPR